MVYNGQCNQLNYNDENKELNKENEVEEDVLNNSEKSKLLKSSEIDNQESVIYDEKIIRKNKKLNQIKKNRINYC